MTAFFPPGDSLGDGDEEQLKAEDDEGQAVQP